jgi:hypothetical protein
MSKITISQNENPIITFSSEEWENSYEYNIVGEEIIAFMKEHEIVENILLQNTSFFFGDSELCPIVMINKCDFGGFKGSLDIYIKDVILDLLPDE